MLSAEIFKGKTTTRWVLFLRIHLVMRLDFIFFVDLIILIKDGGLIRIEEVILICSGLRDPSWVMLLTILMRLLPREVSLVILLLQERLKDTLNHIFDNRMMQILILSLGHRCIGEAICCMAVQTLVNKRVLI